MCSFHTYTKRVTMWNECVNLLDYNHHFTMYIKTSCCICYNQYTLQPIKNKVGFVCVCGQKKTYKNKSPVDASSGVYSTLQVWLCLLLGLEYPPLSLLAKPIPRRDLCYPFPHLFYPMTSLVCYSDFGVF